MFLNASESSQPYRDRTRSSPGLLNLLLIAAALTLLVLFRCGEDESRDSNPPNTVPIVKTDNPMQPRPQDNLVSIRSLPVEHNTTSRL